MSWLAELWPHWRPEWVIHQDDDLLVIDKPAGVPLQTTEPDVAELRPRLVSWLGANGADNPYVGQLHTLDREASGLLVLSRSKAINRSLSQQLANGLRRSYLACVTKVPKPRSIPFDMRIEQRQGPRTLIRLASDARSQPVRRSLAAAGSPIAGDRDNGGAPAARMLLHVSELRLEQPTRGERLELMAPTPPPFERWLAGEPNAVELADANLDGWLRSAIDRRHAIAHDAGTDAFRLVNDVGDDLPGIEIDRYGEHAVVALRDEAAVANCDPILDAVAALGFAGVYLKIRRKHASVLVDTRRDELAPHEAVRGVSASSPLVVREAGLEFRVRLGDGLSTGIFLDQRGGRRRLRELSDGKRVLNLFAYHGAFTVAAIAGGARATVTIDASGAAIDAARENIAMLGVGEAGSPHELVKADAAAWLARSRRNRDRFDVIVLDPPSYSTSASSVFRAARDYRPLAAAALRLLAPGGQLLACCNHRGILRAKFARQLRGAARDAGVDVEHLSYLPDPVDFPAAPGGECHLKSVLLATAR